MKKICIFLAVVLFLTGHIFAGVVKKTKSEVNFTKFGKFSNAESGKISELKKATFSESEFEGKGLVGKIAEKVALRSGVTGEIIDLPGMALYRLDHKKKEYTVNPIVEITVPEAKEEAQEEYEAEKGERMIKIIRSEFKVDDTGETKTINQFPSRKYVITWITEWENTRTGEKGIDKLLTDVWTTPLTGALKQCQEEEMKFSEEYMKRIGLDVNALQQEILGTNWLSLLRQMSGEDVGLSEEGVQFVEEMKKIEGYPVVVDGKFYLSRQGGEQPKEEKGEEAETPKKVLGKFAKKVLKKKPEEKTGEEPAFSYRTELVEYALADIAAGDFQVPAGYKKKG